MAGSSCVAALLTLLALDRAGAQILAIAPSGDQAELVNHQTGATVASEQRNMLVEAARISHGAIGIDRAMARVLELIPPRHH